MGWASELVARLKEGATVQFRPKRNTMNGNIFYARLTARSNGGRKTECRKAGRLEAHK